MKSTDVLRCIFWASLILTVSITSVFELHQSFSPAFLSAAVPLAIVAASLCVLGCYNALRPSFQRRCWVGSFNDVVFVSAHCISMGLYGLAAYFSHDQKAFALPCLPTMMQLFCCTMIHSMRAQAFPISASLVVPIVTYPTLFLQPLPLILAVLASLYTVLECSTSSCPSSLLKTSEAPLVLPALPNEMALVGSTDKIPQVCVFNPLMPAGQSGDFGFDHDPITSSTTLPCLKNISIDFPRLKEAPFPNSKSLPANAMPILVKEAADDDLVKHDEPSSKVTTGEGSTDDLVTSRNDSSHGGISEEAPGQFLSTSKTYATLRDKLRPTRYSRSNPLLDNQSSRGSSVSKAESRDSLYPVRKLRKSVSVDAGDWKTLITASDYISSHATSSDYGTLGETDEVTKSDETECREVGSVFVDIPSKELFPTKDNLQGAIEFRNFQIESINQARSAADGVLNSYPASNPSQGSLLDMFSIKRPGSRDGSIHRKGEGSVSEFDDGDGRWQPDVVSEGSARDRAPSSCFAGSSAGSDSQDSQSRRRKIEADLLEQAGKAVEMKYKYDVLKSAHDNETVRREQAEASVDVLTQQSKEMKNKYDVLNEQMSQAISQKFKADHDLMEHQIQADLLRKQFLASVEHDKKAKAEMDAKFEEQEQRIRELRLNNEDLKSRFDLADSCRQKAEHDLLEQNGAAAAMKQKFDTLKEMYDANGRLVGSRRASGHTQTLSNIVEVQETPSFVGAGEGRAKLENDLLEQAGRTAEFKSKYDAIKEMYDASAQRNADKAAEETQQARELKLKYDYATNKMSQAVEAKLKVDQELLHQKEQTEALQRSHQAAALKQEQMQEDMQQEILKSQRTAAENKVKYDELKLRFDRQANEMNKMQNDMVGEQAKAAEMKVKYDIVKEMHDDVAETHEKVAQDFIQQRHQAAEMKRKYDLSQQQIAQAIEWKSKAAEDLLEQSRQTSEMKAKYDTAIESKRKANEDLRQQCEQTHEMKLKYDEAHEQMQQALESKRKMNEDIIQERQQTHEMKLKYDQAHEQMTQAVEGKRKLVEDIIQERQKTHEMKLKYDNAQEQMQEAQEGKRKAKEDVIHERQQTREMKLKYDQVHEQMLEVVESNRKANEDLIDAKRESHTMKLRYDRAEEQLNEAFESQKKATEDLRQQCLETRLAESKIKELSRTQMRTMMEKKKADDDLEIEAKKSQDLKREYDVLKQNFDTNDAEKEKIQKDLEDQRGKVKDTQKLYSALKKKFDKQKQDSAEQQEDLAKAKNQLKVLRWMLPEPTKDEELPPPVCDPPKSIEEDIEVKSELSTVISFHDAQSYHSSLTNISHDMRTPLTTALSALEILLDTNVRLDEPDRLDLLQKTWAALQNVLILVNNILDFSKISNSGIRAVPKQVHIRRLAVQVLRTLEVQAKQNNVELVFDAGLALPSTIQSDRLLLHRVLMNLLANSLKFTPAQGRVTLSLDYDVNRQVLLGRVVDTGIGMTPKEQASLFKEFYQAGHGKGGTGLGLAISQQIIGELGGTISAYSQGKGLGSTFSFEVSAPFVRSSVPSFDCTSLVIDPDDSRKKALLNMLSYLGVDVDETEAPTAKPDIVFIFESLKWKEVVAQWRGVATTCLCVPNTSVLKVSPGGVVDAVLHSPIDVAELRGILRPISGDVQSDTSSRVSGSVNQVTTPQVVEKSPDPPPKSLMPPPASPSPPSPALPTSPSAGIQALLVEDNTVNHMLFLRHLKNIGITDVKSAYNGLEAVKLAEVNRFTIILMDCEMPIMNGLDATARIRTMPHHATTPIICMTANQSADNVERCRKVGMTDFFPKPVTPQNWQTILKLAEKEQARISTLA